MSAFSKIVLRRFVTGLAGSTSHTGSAKLIGSIRLRGSTRLAGLTELVSLTRLAGSIGLVGLAKLTGSATLAGLLLCVCAPVVWADDSPFSSPEEKAAVLKTAGMDGLIDPWEWEANLRQGIYFADISWDHLSLSDIDGDGRINLNEFFQYYRERVDSLHGKVENVPDEDPLFFDAKPPRPVYLDSFIPELIDSESLDPRALYRRAHIARRMKFSTLTDPEEVFLANKRRSDRLKNIRYRRRLVLDRKQSEGEEEPSVMPDIYRSKLVTDRFSRIPSREPVPAVASPQAGSASTPEAEADAAKERGENPLDALGEAHNMPQPDTAVMPMTVEPALPSNEPSPDAESEKTVETQNLSNIRGLIPKTKAGGKEKTGEAVKSDAANTK